MACATSLLRLRRGTVQIAECIHPQDCKAAMQAAARLQHLCAHCSTSQRDKLVTAPQAGCVSSPARAQGGCCCPLSQRQGSGRPSCATGRSWGCLHYVGGSVSCAAGQLLNMMLVTAAGHSRLQAACSAQWQPQHAAVTRPCRGVVQHWLGRPGPSNMGLSMLDISCAEALCSGEGATSGATTSRLSPCSHQVYQCCAAFRPTV